MRTIIQDKHPMLIFESLGGYENIAHFITTKQGWRSGENARFTGDNETCYAGFREELVAACGADAKSFVFPRQTHSDRVVIVDSSTSGADVVGVDALITNELGLFVCVQTADCVPILLFDPVMNVVAAVHSGWRGTVARIAKKTIEKMIVLFGSSPENIIAGIGPSIGVNVYEVGTEVVSAVRSEFNNSATLLHPSANEGKFYLDLWEANKTVLTDSGVLERNIETMGLCSFEKPDLFYSARRDGIATGRMVSAIRLNSPI